MQIDQKTVALTIIRAIAIIMVLWALADNPYGYYKLLRWVVTTVAVIMAFQCIVSEKIYWTIPVVKIAILFNPILPIHLDRETWRVIDIAVAVIFSWNTFSFKPVIQVVGDKNG